MTYDELICSCICVSKLLSDFNSVLVVLVGTLVMKKAPACYERELKIIANHLLSIGTPVALSFRAYIVAIFHAAGRSGELGLTTADMIHFDSHFRCLLFDWATSKANKMKYLNFFTHREHYSVDVLHALFCYFTATSTATPCGNFCFPELQGVKDSGSKINKVFAKYYESREGKLNKIPPGLTTRSLRVGAINLIGDELGILAAITRSGHDFSGYSAVFEYVLQLPITDRKCGRLLGGWGPDVGGKSPLLTDLPCLDPCASDYDESYAMTVGTVLDNLFGNRHGLREDVKSALLCAFLRSMKEYATDHGEHDWIMTRVMTVAQHEGISRENLFAMGAALQTIFLDKNKAALSDGHLMSDEADVVHIPNRTLVESVNRQGAVLSTIMAKVDSLTTLMKQLTPPTGGASESPAKHKFYTPASPPKSLFPMVSTARAESGILCLIVALD